MQIGVLGTGMVGRAIGTRLVELGHDVRMGSRSAANAAAREWAESAGERASTGTFADAAGFGEIVINCTAGMHSTEALALAGDDSLGDKVVIDIANPLDFSGGMPPRLSVVNDDSLAEQLQRAHPRARVVKGLNTMNCGVMVNPDSIPGDHVTFICGDDADARAAVTALLAEMGWPAARVLDLGDLKAARGLEMVLPLWLGIMGSFGNANFNFAIAR